MLEEPGPGRGLGKCVKLIDVDEGSDRPGVVEEIGDGFGLELWVDHHHYRPDLQDAEQRRHVGWATREGDDHPLLGGDAGLLEQVPEPIRHFLYVAVGELALVGDQGTTVRQSFSDAGVEEIIGDVERVGWGEWHWES